MTVTVAWGREVTLSGSLSAGCEVLTTAAVPAGPSVGRLLVVAGVSAALGGSVGAAVAAGIRVGVDVAVCRDTARPVCAPSCRVNMPLPTMLQIRTLTMPKPITIRRTM